MTITGTGFSTTAANDTVKFGTTTVPTASITAASATQLTVTAPSASAVGVVDVTVTVGANTSSTGTADHFTYVPTVTAVGPTSGSTGGGTSVTITGTGFTGATGVTIGGVAATGFSVASATSITAATPAGSAGPASILVTVGGVTNTANTLYTYAAPTVTSVSPTSAASGTTPSITINGTNFTPSATVKVGGTAATGVTYVSASQLTATAPSMTAGTYDVVVTTGTVSTATSAADRITYASPTATLAIASKTLTAGQPSASFTPVTGSGGTGALTYTISPTLPSPLQISSSTGLITGVPAAAASATNYTVTVTDTNNATASQTFSLTIDAAPTAVLAIASKTLTAGQPSASFTPVTASGGTGALTYTISPPLPSALSLNSASGLITGVPAAAAGATNYTVTATDANNATASQTFSLTIDAAPTAVLAIASKTLTAGQASASFTPVTASGGNGTLTYTISPPLPSALSLNSANGLITGVPAAAAGATNYTVTATDADGGAGSQTFSLTIDAAPTAVLAIASKTLTAGQPSASFTPVTASGGNGALTYSVLPILPSALSLNSASGLITGVPAAAASATNYTVTATDSDGVAASQTFSLTIDAAPTAVLAIASKTLTAGQPSASFTPVTASGGNGALIYSVLPTLPSALSLNSASGLITGVPAVAAGAANYTVTATDADGATASQTFSLTIDAAPTAVLAIPSQTLGVGQASASFTPVTASGGNGTLTYTISPPLPSALSLNSASGLITGVPAAAAGATNYTVTVTDIDGAAASQTFSLTIIAPPTVATVGATVAYDSSANPITLSFGGGTATSVAVSTAASHGTATASGTSITYTPTTGYRGTDSFAYTATNVAGTSTPATATITVSAPTISVTPTTLTAGTAGVAYSQSLTASGGQSPYSYSTTVASGALPNGLSLSSTGAISGTPTAVGSFTFTVSGTDSSTGTAVPFTSPTITLAIAAPTIALTPSSLPGGISGTAYSQTVTASGGTAPYTYSVSSGALPMGLALNGSTGVISGTPTAVSTSNFTIKATDSTTGTGAPYFGTQAYTIATTPVLPTAGAVSATVAFNSSANPITLSLGGGAPTSVAVASAASHGTATASGTSITYTPTSGYSGADSFTYTATNATGTSTPATVSITVTPQVPTTAAVSATVAFNSSANPISLNLGGGTAASVAVASGASHGNAVASGTSITYTPTSGYSGSDSFTYTATNTGGTSSPATVTITVTPQVPTAGAVTATVAYNSSANPITLNLGGGTAVSVAVASAASHGNAAASGTSITYTPTSGYSGSDSFTYTATNTGGTSTAGTVTITVNPQLPSVAAVSATVAYGSSANPISLSFGGGTATSVAVASAASHGNAAASGTSITYTPTAGYSGSDSFTYTATNVTGTSMPATVTITVTPQVPAAGAVSATVAYNSSANPITLNLSGGTAVSVAIASAASHGNAAASGTSITYTPAAGYSGPDSFTYTATNTGGTSSAGTVTITVNPQAPTAGAVSASVTGNSSANPITLNLGGGAATSVAIASAASHGNAVASGTSITYTPTVGYAGPDSFTYTAHNVTATSAAATVSITVVAPTLALSPTTLPAGTVEAAYSQTLTASGGTAPYTYSVASGSLPAGLTLSTTGALSGTPTAGGSFPVTLKATDATGFSVSQAYTLAVGAATVSLSPATLPAPQVKAAYSQTLVASGGVAPYHYAVTSGQLPPGLSLNATTGVVSGTPTQAGSYNATIQATDSSTGNGPYHASINFQLPTSQQVPVAAAVTSTTPANIRDAINVGASVTGPINSVAVASNPAHGTAVPSGVNIVYTPAANFFGTDSFTYTATGPGGTSAPATVTVTVTPLAVPVAQPLTAQILTNASVTLNATASASNGPFTAVAIATPPSAGTAVVNGQNIVYTPVPGQTVTANISFTYTVANVYGASAPATVTITVNPIPVPPPPQTIVTPPPSPTSDGSASADITSNAAGGPFVSASLINVTPANAGTVTLVPITSQTGSIAPTHVFAELLGIKPAVADTVTVNGHAFKIVFTPNPGFIGTVSISYSLANAFAGSVPGELMFVVPPRADISADADVAGLVAAQVEEARRFATAQIGNFNQRLEALHGDGPARSSNGLSVNFGDQATTAAQSDPDDNPLTRGTMDVHRLSRNDARGGQDQNNTASGQQGAKRQDGGDGESILPANLAFWTAGSVDFGARSSVAQRSGFNFTTDGVSAGADYRLDPHFTIGLGGGYGHDESDVGSDGTKSIADSYSAAIYGSYHPSTDTFLDGVLGYGTLSYDSTRLITTTTDFAHGHRGGEQSFGSLTGGYEYKTDTIRLTPYGRFDYSDSTLDRFSETAPGRAALTYFAQSQTALTATLGFKGDLAIPLDWGLFLPFLRAELEHDFQAASRAGLAYADLASAGPAYFVAGDPVDRNHIQLGIGANLKVGNYTFGLAYENSFGIHEEQDSQIRLLVTAHF